MAIMAMGVVVCRHHNEGIKRLYHIWWYSLLFV